MVLFTPVVRLAPGSLTIYGFFVNITASLINITEMSAEITRRENLFPKDCYPNVKENGGIETFGGS